MKNGNGQLIYWRALYVDYDTPPETVAAGAVPRLERVRVFTSDDTAWKDLPKIGVIAMTLFIKYPDQTTAEVHNGYSQYCPYNEPCGLDDEADYIKWGVWIEEYSSFRACIENERKYIKDFKPE